MRSRTGCTGRSFWTSSTSASEAIDEEKFEKEREARFKEALADSSIGEEDGYASEDARFFLNFGDKR